MWTTAKITLNTDAKDTGSVTATYTDETYGTFTYSEERVTADEAGQVAFATRANSAKNTWLTKLQSAEVYNEALLLALKA